MMMPCLNYAYLDLITFPIACHFSHFFYMILAPKCRELVLYIFEALEPILGPVHSWYSLNVHSIYSVPPCSNLNSTH